MIKDLTLADLHEAAIASGEISKPFWRRGEIADLIRGMRTHDTTRKREMRLEQWLHSNGHACFSEEMHALCLWQQHLGRSVKIPVLGFKYLLLKEEEHGGGAWTTATDTIAEDLARGIVRRQKEA